MHLRGGLGWHPKYLTGMGGPGVFSFKPKGQLQAKNMKGCPGIFLISLGCVLYPTTSLMFVASCLLRLQSFDVARIRVLALGR